MDSNFPELATAPRAPNSIVTSRLRLGLGTFVAISAESASVSVGEAAVSAAFDAVALVERLMHPTRAGSDLASLRDDASGVPRTVHAWTWEVLDLCKRLHRLSGGIFDPCLPSSGGRLSDLELTSKHGVIQHASLRLDLGGVAKGYAVDRALGALRAAGCAGGLVNAGGDLAVFGDRRHEVFFRDRRGSATLVVLQNAALAASDVDPDSRPLEHQGYYHGADGSIIVSGRALVMAPSAAVADGLTKCILVGGASNASLLEKFGARRVEC
jgi:thiamine biosynthesis lipoprotein